MNPDWRCPFPGAVNAGMNPCLKDPSPASNDSGYNYRHYLNQQQQHSSTTTTQSNSGWDRPGSSLQNKQCAEPKADEDSDGDTYESDEEEEPKEEDPELARKRKELEEIEKQIMMKKAFLAQRIVNVQNPKPKRFSEEPKSTKSNKTLRERVKHMLQVRKREIRTNGSLVTSRRHTFNAVYDHPLKFKVVVALQQRLEKPSQEPQKFKTSPPCQKEASLVKEEVNTANEGFMCFLSLLNKGVNIDKFTEIVNDETDDVPRQSQNGAEMDIATTSAKPPAIVRKNSWEDYSFINIPNKRKDNEKVTEIVSDETDNMPHDRQADRVTSTDEPPVKVREKIWKNDCFMKTHNKRMHHDELTDTVNEETDDWPHRTQPDRTTSSVKSSGIVRERLWESYDFFHKLNKGLDNDKSTEIVRDEADYMQHRSRTDRATSSFKPPVKVRENLQEQEFLSAHNKRVPNSKLTDMVNDKPGNKPLSIKISVQNDYAISAKRTIIVNEKSMEKYSFLKTSNKELDNDKPTEKVYDETYDLPHGSQTRCTSSIKRPVKVRERSLENRSFFKELDNDKHTETGNGEKDDMPLHSQNATQNESTSSLKPPVMVPGKLQAYYSLVHKLIDGLRDDEQTEIVNNNTDKPLRRKISAESDRATSSVKHPVVTRKKLQEDNSFFNTPKRRVASDKPTQIINDYPDDMADRSETDDTSSVSLPGLVMEKLREDYSFLNTNSKDLDNDDKPMEGVNYKTDSITQKSQTDTSTSSLKPPVVAREKLREDYSFLNAHCKGLDNDDKPMERVNDKTDNIPQRSQIDLAASSVKPPVIVREKLPEEEQMPSGDDPQKHLLNVLETLGISLGTDEISRLNDRTQERLYGKKPSAKTKRTESADASEEKTQIEEPQQEKETKNSPVSFERSSSVPGPSHFSNQNYPHNTHAFLYNLPNAPLNNPTHEETMHVASDGIVQNTRCLVTLVDPEKSQNSQWNTPLPNPNLTPVSPNNNWACNQTPIPGPDHFSHQNYPHNTAPFPPNLPNAQFKEPTHQGAMNGLVPRCLVSLTPGDIDPFGLDLPPVKPKKMRTWLDVSPRCLVSLTPGDIDPFGPDLPPVKCKKMRTWLDVIPRCFVSTQRKKKKKKKKKLLIVQPNPQK